MATSPRRSNDRVRRALLAVALVAASAARPIDEDPVPGPRAVIEHVAKEVTRVMRDPKLDDEGKRAGIEKLVHEYVDFRTVAKLVLARNYKKFSPEQLASFEQEFERHLFHTYWRNAESANFERIDLLTDREETRGDWTVETRVIAGSDETRMDYRLRRLATPEGKPPGEWKVIDLIIENVSLIANFRAQFREILSNKSPDDVIAMLRKKNTEADEAEKKASGG